MTTENQTPDNIAPAAAAAPAPTESGRPFRGPRPGRPSPAGDGEENTEGAAPTRAPGQQIRRPRRPGGRDRFAPRRRVDQFGLDGIREIDYKDFQRLRRYLSDRGKIEPRRKTGLSAYHQRSLTTAIKRARFMALLPFVINQSR